jgi:hypothetical protein
METTTKNHVDLIKQLLPNKVELFHLDYRDEYENYEAIQEAMQKGCYSPIDEDIDSWLWQTQYENMKYYKKDLKKDLEKHIDEDEIDQFMDDSNCFIEDILFSRDVSNPTKDLINTAGNIACFYDTGYEVQSESWSWTKAEMTQEIRNVKKHLGIKGKENDEAIQQMLEHASYGGSLVVYFNPDIPYMIETSGNTIKFTHPHIAVINIHNGSGWHCQVTGEISLALNRANFFVDKTIKYSYTHEVCDMYDTWCNSTGVEITTKKTRKKTEKSGISEVVERDNKYKEIFAKGLCSAGDMDITRHRNKTYINDFPCGTKCLDCGTFWID